MLACCPKPCLDSSSIAPMERYALGFACRVVDSSSGARRRSPTPMSTRIRQLRRACLLNPLWTFHPLPRWNDRNTLLPVAVRLRSILRGARTFKPLNLSPSAPLNRLRAGLQGGGVYVASNGVANFEDCNIHDNTAYRVCLPSALTLNFHSSPR